MEQNSSTTQMLGSQNDGQANTPPPSFSSNPGVTPTPQGSSVAEPTFCSFMLQQMKSMIDAAVEGALERWLAAMGANLVTPSGPISPPLFPEIRGNNEKEKLKHNSRS